MLLHLAQGSPLPDAVAKALGLPVPSPAPVPSSVPVPPPVPVSLSTTSLSTASPPASPLADTELVQSSWDPAIEARLIRLALEWLGSPHIEDFTRTIERASSVAMRLARLQAVQVLAGYLKSPVEKMQYRAAVDIVRATADVDRIHRAKESEQDFMTTPFHLLAANPRQLSTTGTRVLDEAQRKRLRQEAADRLQNLQPDPEQSNDSCGSGSDPEPDPLN